MENKGISEFIKQKLRGITKGNALAMTTLTNDLIATFPQIKDATNASVRVNSVLKQKAIMAEYDRIKSENKVYITLKSDMPDVTTVETVVETVEKPVDLGKIDLEKDDDEDEVTPLIRGEKEDDR